MLAFIILTVCMALARADPDLQMDDNLEQSLRGTLGLEDPETMEGDIEEIDDNLERSLGPDSESQLDTLAPEDPTAEEDIAERRLRKTGLPIKNLGCFKDSMKGRAIPFLEGKCTSLKGFYRKRKDAIRKCYLAAKAKGYKCFGLQHGGACMSGKNACKTYAKHGRARNCNRYNGKGGGWANQVYKIKG